ncbi:MAG: alpha/beta hydrolase [Acidobacteria bacterium]|nr:MAG: alpha/beta hydrolase [Acidobacteriota bacterium]
MGRSPDIRAPGALAPVGRHRLHYRCDGDGMPGVVLDAGIAASSLSWARVQPEVARFTRVCSYDRAGLAWSDLSTTPRSISTLVDELRQVIDHAGIAAPYVLVGHSFGGLVIRAFARAHLADVAGLVFVDPLHPEEWSMPSAEERRVLRGGIFLSRVGEQLARVGLVRFLLSRLTGGAPGLPRRVSRMFGPRASALLVNIVGEVQKLPEEVLPAVQEHWSNPKAFRGMWQHLAALPSASAEMMRGIDAFGDMPLIVLSAGRRHPRWLAADASLARSSTNGRHLVSPGSGHWVHLDDPALVVQVIRDVVMQVRSARLS